MSGIGVLFPNRQLYNNNSSGPPERATDARHGDRATSKRRRREARRERRLRRRIFLFVLLAMASSPSLIALLYSIQRTRSVSNHNKKSTKGEGGFDNGPSVGLESAQKGKALIEEELYRAAQRIDLDKWFIPPEQKDPNFGLPQIIIPERDTLKKEESSAPAVASSAGVLCENDDEGPCCALWTFNTDKWLTNHFDWEVGYENQTHTCFVRIRDKERVDFLHRVYGIQWENTCANSWQHSQLSSGYSKALSAIVRSFHAAFKKGIPFQYNKHHETSWNYATSNSTHWSYCRSQDIHCYFLPLGKCEPILGLNNAEIKEQEQSTALEYSWLRQFAFRTRHSIRKHLMEYTSIHRPKNMRTPCSVIYFDREGVGRRKGRRHVTVHDYIKAGNISKGGTVVILTDDSTAMEEIREYHESQYNWVYLQRSPFEGRGSESELVRDLNRPTKDPAVEILAMMLELRLASTCNKLVVHGESWFVQSIQDSRSERDFLEVVNMEK